MNLRDPSSARRHGLGVASLNHRRRRSASAHPTIHNCIVNHPGISVPDLDAAIAWYTSVLGFQVVVPAVEVAANDGKAGEGFAWINGPKFSRGRVAYLTADNRVGVKYSSLSIPRPKRSPTIAGPSIWHLCLTMPDVTGLTASIAANGGRRSVGYRDPI